MKNQSERTFDKQVELANILKTLVLVGNVSEFSFNDIYGGSGMYEIYGRLCKGSSLIAHDTLSKDHDIIRRYPGFVYNGCVLEKNRKNFKSLNENLKRYCPNHRFITINQCNKRALWFDGNPMAYYSKGGLLKNGLIYFDPPGATDASLIQSYSARAPQYSLLCNFQRGITIRSMGRSLKNPVKDLMLDRSLWLLSKPVERVGFSWLLKVNDSSLINLVRDGVNNRNSSELLINADSAEGAKYFRIFTEVGHSIYKNKNYGG